MLQDLIERLKVFDADRGNMTELLLLSATAASLKAEHVAHSVEIPEWLENNTKALHREIKSRNSDSLRKQLRDAELRFETLKTTSEKRTDAMALINDLKKKIAASA